LGEYRYYDMDQAIARAQMLAGRLLAKHSGKSVRAKTWSPELPTRGHRKTAAKAWPKERPVVTG
jgi:hypothetical protein